METKSTRKVRRIFRNHFKFKRVICFKNPSECTQLKIERINPNHVGTIWGKRKGKNTNMIKVGKVYFNIIPVAYGLSVVAWLDAFTGYQFRLLLNVGLLSMITGVACGIICYFPFLVLSWKSIKEGVPVNG